MCKKKNKEVVTPVYTESEDIAPVAEPTPIVQRENDYFEEYYKKYKNNYIDQYLNAYHKYKETGEVDDILKELQGFDTETPSNADQEQ